MLLNRSTLNHVLSRIKTYKNWFTIVWPVTRIISPQRILRTRLGPKIKVRSVFGPDFVVTHEMFYRDDYNISSIQFDCSEPVVIDVGANIGTFSLLVNCRNPRAKIFAYEPELSNYELTEENIRLNGVGHNIKCFSLAVAETEGNKTFYISTLEYAHSLEMENIEGGDFNKKITVNTTTIEQILKSNNLDRLDLLKLDIEGTEYAVLYNLPLDLYNKIKYIALEIHDHKTYQKEELVNFLTEKGYSVARSNKNPHVYLAKHK